MEWDDFYENLLHYIAGLYPFDNQHDVKKRLIGLAGMPVPEFRYQLNDIDLWHSILKFAKTRRRIIPLLRAIITNLGGDDYLEGALLSLETAKVPADRPVPQRDWANPDADKSTKEKIIGKRSNLLPIQFLEKGILAARSVVRIELPDKTGTGFLLKEGWLMTNNHILGTPEEASTAFVQFNFQPMEKELPADRPVRVKADLEITLQPAAEEFITDAAPLRDWTLVRVGAADRERILTYGHLSLANRPAKKDDFVNIIQHPLGGPKQLGIYNNLVVLADQEKLQYLTDTNDGSSGSPVMNSDWQVVGLHHSGGWYKDPASDLLVKRNQGTPVSAIAALSKLDLL